MAGTGLGLVESVLGPNVFPAGRTVAVLELLLLFDMVCASCPQLSFACPLSELSCLEMCCSFRLAVVPLVIC